MSTATTSFPRVRLSDVDGILQKGSIGENIRLALWDGMGAEATIHRPTDVRATFVPSEYRDEGGFVSVVVTGGKDEVKGYLTPEDAVALRNALNDAIAEAERGA